MASDKPSPIAELRRRLSQPGPWADRLRRLAADLAALDDDGPSTTEPALTCVEVESILDVVADDELSERTMSSHAAAHLITCARCRQAYALLLDALVAESAKESPPIAVPARPMLSFLQPAVTDQPWLTRLRSALTGEAFGLSISLNVAYLHRLFFAPQPLLVRADEALAVGPITQLLLSDAVTVGDQLLAIELTAQRDHAQADEVSVQAVLTGSEPLPPDLWATLTWAGETHQSPVDAQGQANFGRVSLPVLHTAAHSFELLIETRPELND